MSSVKPKCLVFALAISDRYSSPSLDFSLNGECNSTAILISYFSAIGMAFSSSRMAGMSDFPNVGRRILYPNRLASLKSRSSSPMDWSAVRYLSGPYRMESTNWSRQLGLVPYLFIKANHCSTHLGDGFG